MDDTTLAMLASDWESDPIDVAEDLAQVAIAVARSEHEEEKGMGT